MHNTGTWHVDGGCIVDDRGNVVAVRKSWERLEEANGHIEPSECISPTQADENAHLIASAPDLLNALTCAILHLQDADHRGGWHTPESEIACMQKAIDKATNTSNTLAAS